MLIDSANGSYLLGVIHGDGNIDQRSIRVYVDIKKPYYAQEIINAWELEGYSPKTNETTRGIIEINVYNKRLRDELSQFKAVDKWMFPAWPSSFSEYLAGLIDTDGYVSEKASGNRVNITQKAADKLPNIRYILDMLGFENVPIRRRLDNKLRGGLYPIDTIWWNNKDDIIKLHQTVKLRHRDKADRLERCILRIQEFRDNNKSAHILKYLRDNNGAKIPDICEALGYDRSIVLAFLNKLRRQGRAIRNDPPIDTLTWNWIDSNRYKKGIE